MTTTIDFWRRRIGGGSRAPAAAASAAAVTIPHALGLGLLAYAPLAGELPVAALALWSAALPGAVATLVAARTGVVYAPTTVVALLYAAVVASLAGSAASLGMSAAQVLAACGATAALACGLQWLFGAMRLASLARFLPISVMHGFAAGVGLSMVLGQVRTGFGSGDWALDHRTAIHAAAALAVVGVALLVGRRWRTVPGLLPGVAVVAAVIWLFGWSDAMQPAVAATGFALPPVPDHVGVPWRALLAAHGIQLVSLALLMALVNSLDVLVFNQERELEHGLRSDPNQFLRRESAIGALCALCGLIPASTSASRSRIALSQAGPAGAGVPQWHALLMVLVAATGHWWLHWVPMACLAGALLLAGTTQVPAAMWSRGYASAASSSWNQSWLVALVFCVAGGMGALIAGLVVATFVLLHASASNVVRRVLVHGEVRSRRLRRAAAEAWLPSQMNRVAVVELQGVMSFGVAAYAAERVRLLLEPRHAWVVLDASRVPAWDNTALAQLRALSRDLAQQGRSLRISGLHGPAAQQVERALVLHTDLDRALEAVEEALLAGHEAAGPAVPAGEPGDALGEIGEHLSGPGRHALQEVMRRSEVPPGACIFQTGDRQDDLCVVVSGQVSMCTAWPPSQGLRLVTIGPGMVFGEMAFLNGLARTACAGAETEPVCLARLGRADFDRWSRAWPAEALVIMNNLALMGTRRLAATTRQLRAVLE